MKTNLLSKKIKRYLLSAYLSSAYISIKWQVQFVQSVAIHSLEIKQKRNQKKVAMFGSSNISPKCYAQCYI